MIKRLTHPAVFVVILNPGCADNPHVLRVRRIVPRCLCLECLQQ
ncbi:hypothetical protein F385_3837 [Pantoea agglomerans 299R]|nr:hypothetical protein F385_3837 [Pantoea agglomerans 299R]